MNDQKDKITLSGFFSKPAVQSITAALLCIIIGLLVGYIALLMINPSGATQAIITILKNFFTYPSWAAARKYLGNTLVKAAPLLMCALSIQFCYQAGLFNIGASGQYTVGAFCALLVLMYFYQRLKNDLKSKQALQNIDAVQETSSSIISRLLKLALPVSLTSLMLPVVANLDLLIVPQRLEVAGFDVRHATELFGYLTGMAVPLVNLSTIFTAALAISLVPAISEARALGWQENIRHKTGVAFRVAMIVTFPCFAGLFCLAEKVAGLIYNAPGAAPAIQAMSIGIVLLGMHQVSTAVLQGMGRTSIPVLNMIAACVVKVCLNWTLTAIPWLGIRGSAMATVADFGVAALINMYFVYKLTGYKMSGSGILKPMIAAGVMGAAIQGVLYAASGLGGWVLLLCVPVAAVVYGVVLTAIGGLTKEDLESLPYLGTRILRIGQKLGAFKE